MRPIVYNLLASNFILLVPAYVSPLVTERITSPPTSWLWSTVGRRPQGRASTTQRRWIVSYLSSSAVHTFQRPTDLHELVMDYYKYDTVESMSKQCYKIQKYGIYPTRSFQRSKLEKQVAKGGTAKRTQSIDATIAILFTLLLSCTKATMGYIILCINLIQQFLGITCQ